MIHLHLILVILQQTVLGGNAYLVTDKQDPRDDLVQPSAPPSLPRSENDTDYWDEDGPALQMIGLTRKKVDTNACTKDDLDAISKAGPGSTGGTLPRITFECNKKAVRFR